MENEIRKYKGVKYLAYWHELDEGRSGMAFFCAYVRLPYKHPYRRFCTKRSFFDSRFSYWQMKKMMAEEKGEKFVEKMPKRRKGSCHYDGYEKMNIDCHGGLTFSRRIENHKLQLSKGNWIGWDYGHYGDQTYNVNPKKVDLRIDRTILERLNEGGKIWTKEEVEEHCRNVIDQILRIKK